MAASEAIAAAAPPSEGEAGVFVVRGATAVVAVVATGVAAGSSNHLIAAPAEPARGRLSRPPPIDPGRSMPWPDEPACEVGGVMGVVAVELLVHAVHNGACRAGVDRFSPALVTICVYAGRIAPRRRWSRTQAAAETGR